MYHRLISHGKQMCVFWSLKLLPYHVFQLFFLYHATLAECYTWLDSHLIHRHLHLFWNVMFYQNNFYFYFCFYSLNWRDWNLKVLESRKLRLEFWSSFFGFVSSKYVFFASLQVLFCIWRNSFQSVIVSMWNNCYSDVVVSNTGINSCLKWNCVKERHAILWLHLSSWVFLGLLLLLLERLEDIVKSRCWPFLFFLSLHNVLNKGKSLRILRLQLCFLRPLIS